MRKVAWLIPFLFLTTWGRADTALTLYDSTTHYFQLRPPAVMTQTYKMVMPLTTGATSQFLSIQGVQGNIITMQFATGSGGGGTPSLPFNSVQFNNVGSFGGDSQFTYDGNFLSLGTSPHQLQFGVNQQINGVSSIAADDLQFALTAKIGGQIILQAGNDNTQGIYLWPNAWVQVTSSVSIQGPGGLGVKYNLNVGSMTGAGLSTCGDSSHALAYNSGTGTFSCQAITTGVAWGSITGTLSNQTDLQNALNAVGVSTAALAVSTGTLFTLANGKVNYSSFSATVPIIYNNVTGAFSLTQISLSSGVTGILPVANMVSTAAFTTSTQTFTGSITFFNPVTNLSSETITGAGGLKISFGFISSTMALTAFNVTGTSATVTGTSGLGVAFNVNVGSMTGANLSTCGDATHALGYNSATGLFSCQNVTGSGGGGGSSTLEVLAGVNRTSPTVTVGFPGPPFLGTVTGSSMTITLDGSSVTMRGQGWSNTVDSATTTFKTRLDNLDTSTATLTTRLIAVGVSTTAIASDTGTLTTRIIAVGVSTAAIAVDTGTINTIVSGHTTRLIAVGVSTAAIAVDTGTLTSRIISVGISTAAIAVDTGTINTALSTKVNYASFSVTGLPLTYNNVTGAIGITQISLSSGAVSVLPSGLMVSSSAFTTSSQTYTGAPVFVSSTTHLGALVISSSTLLGGTPGTNGQVYTSAGPGAVPSWQTPTGGGGGASTLEVLAGVQRTSPTVTVGFPVPAFTGVVTGSSMTVGLDGSSVTMRGQNWSNLVDSSTSSLQSNFPVSLSTNVANILPSTLLVSTVAFLSSTQTWTAGQTFTSSTTLTSAVVIQSTFAPANSMVINSTNALAAFSFSNSTSTAGDFLLTVSSVPTNAAVPLTQNLFSVDTNGVALHIQQTVAIIGTLTPVAAGELVGCSNCTALMICISTGTTRGAWSSPVAKTTACN